MSASTNGAGPTPDDPRTPFERFEDLAKAIVSVPKREIDAERKTAKKRPRRVSQ